MKECKIDVNYSDQDFAADMQRAKERKQARIEAVEAVGAKSEEINTMSDVIKNKEFYLHLAKICYANLITLFSRKIADKKDYFVGAKFDMKEFLNNCPEEEVDQRLGEFNELPHKVLAQLEEFVALPLDDANSECIEKFFNDVSEGRGIYGKYHIYCPEAKTIASAGIKLLKIYAGEVDNSLEYISLFMPGFVDSIKDSIKTTKRNKNELQTRWR